MSVIVVGGGIQGASVALHLVRLGAGDVTLVERDGIAQGTTAAGAGFVAIWAAGFISTFGEGEAAVERYGLEFYAELAADHDIDYARNGVLWVAPDEAAWASLQPLATFEGRAERWVVEPDEIEAMTTIIPAAGVRAGVFLPEAAQISAAKAAQAVAARFVDAGGSLRCRTPVVSLLGDASRVTGVRTAHGDLEADVVVLAAGAWTRELLAPLGVFLPAAPLLTSRMITEPVGIPRDMPALFLGGLSAIDTLWVRGHHGALLWGGHYRAAPEQALLDEPLPERFDQLVLDGVQTAQRAAVEASAYVPVMGRYRSVTLAHGAPCFTADVRSLLGRVPGVDGVYAMAGDNEGGVTHGPGYGRLLAEAIVSGDEAPLDAWRLDRFGTRFATERDVAAAFHSRS